MVLGSRVDELTAEVGELRKEVDTVTLLRCRITDQYLEAIEKKINDGR